MASREFALVIIFSISGGIGCKEQTTDSIAIQKTEAADKRKRAKFEPEEGK